MKSYNSKHFASVFTDDQIADIRKMSKSNAKYTGIVHIARKYGVNKSTIWRIKNKLNGHNEPKPTYKKISKTFKRSLCIVKDFNNGMERYELADKYNLSLPDITKAINTFTIIEN